MTKPHPHDGWYNGNPELMILNGTYADFRDDLIDDFNKILPPDEVTERIARYDKQWNDIPFEVRLKRRSQVVADSTPKMVEIAPGKVVLKAKPSDNGILSREVAKKLTPRPMGRAPGALTEENNPLKAIPKAVLSTK